MAAKKRTAMIEETRGKLIAAARKTFAEQGYAAASMDELTASVGLTRGALYHHFGDKKGLLQAVIDQMNVELLAQTHAARAQAESKWLGLIAEGITYIRLALEPEVQRIMLLDGPAVLGDPSQWPSQNVCIDTTRVQIEQLMAEGVVRPVDAEAAARLINGAALNAALWIAAAEAPHTVLPKAVEAFRVLSEGLLNRA